MAGDEKPFTEPSPVPDVFTTGAYVERLDGTIRIVAWVDYREERRIMSRWVMSASTARGLAAELRKMIARSGH